MYSLVVIIVVIAEGEKRPTWWFDTKMAFVGEPHERASETTNEQQKIRIIVFEGRRPL